MIVRAATLAVLFATAAHAHGTPPAPAHGGIVQEGSGEHWVELAVSGDALTVWVSDGANTPIPSARLGGRATVLADGKTQIVTLTPAAANSLSGALAAPAAGPVTTVLALTADGKPVQVRFAAPKS